VEVNRIEGFIKVFACVNAALVSASIVLWVVGTVHATVIHVAVPSIHLPVVVRCPTPTGGILILVSLPTLLWGWRWSSSWSRRIGLFGAELPAMCPIRAIGAL